MDNEDKNDLQYCSCVWCGQWITKNSCMKRVERNLPDWNVCKDCRDIRKAASLGSRINKKTIHPELGVLYCAIWKYELNEDWHPIDDEGNLFMPGLRICGLKDCVNSEHVIRAKVLKMSGVTNG
jgi:hypothetical protein